MILTVFICCYSTATDKIFNEIFTPKRYHFNMFEIFHTIFKYREKESPDKLGLFPEAVHVNAMPERRYLWTSRILVVLACLSISLNMMLASTIYILLPQRTAQPKLLRINDYFSELQQIQPAELYVSVNDLVAEEHIYKYIQLRYTITNDYDEIKRRWGEYSTVYWYSDPTVYSDFEKTELRQNFDQFRTQSLTRKVDVEWIRIMATGVWQVQFRTSDYTPTSKTPKVNIWRATMRIGYGPVPFRNRDDLAKNPYGFRIWNYSLGYLGTQERSSHYLDVSKESIDKVLENR